MFDSRIPETEHPLVPWCSGFLHNSLWTSGYTVSTCRDHHLLFTPVEQTTGCPRVGKAAVKFRWALLVFFFSWASGVKVSTLLS